MFYSWKKNKFDKELLNKCNGFFDKSSFNENLSGRFFYKKSDVEFDCFLKKANSDKLLVFLNSSSYRKNNESIFHRISWTADLNANMFYIDDPMHLRYKDIVYSWYYGEEDKSYLKIITEIVSDIATKLKIKKENIVFIGSSSGGYASIFCANHLIGSKSYAYNPQIIINDWPGSKIFVEKTNFNIKKQDLLKRNDISYFINNTESSFFIHSNILSSIDVKQLETIIDFLNIKSEGLYQKDNLYLALTPINILNKHSCLSDREDLVFAIDILFKKFDFLCDSSIVYFEKYIKLAEQNDIANYNKHWDNFLRNELPDFLSPPNRLYKNRLDFECNDQMKVFYYRIIYDDFNLNYKFIFYIQAGDEINISFLKIIENTFKDYSYNINFEKDRGFIRVEFSKYQIEYHQANNIFTEFAKNTYYTSYDFYKKYFLKGNPPAKPAS